MWCWLRNLTEWSEKLEINGFTVRELYLQPKSTELVGYIFISKLRTLLKIKMLVCWCLKISSWQKYYLIRRGWTRNDQCHFCGHKETMNRVLFGCNLSKLICQVALCALELIRRPDKAGDVAILSDGPTQIGERSDNRGRGSEDRRPMQGVRWNPDYHLMKPRVA